MVNIYQAAICDGKKQTEWANISIPLFVEHGQVRDRDATDKTTERCTCINATDIANWYHPGYDISDKIVLRDEMQSVF